MVASARKLIGATNPLQSEPGTIRGDFAIEVRLRRASHRSKNFCKQCSGSTARYTRVKRAVTVPGVTAQGPNQCSARVDVLGAAVLCGCCTVLAWCLGSLWFGV